MADKYYPFPMATFKEIEPTLKKCFNIDRNTPTIAKCLYYSISSEELHKIPENYLLEDGEPDFDAYTIDYAESLIIPISETCSTTDFNNFCQSNNIEYGTTLYEILAFLLLFNDTSNKKYSTDLDHVEQEYSEYDLYVRPELLKLYMALKESKNYEPISIRFGCSKPIKVDNDIPWLREELERYLDKYLGVADIREAKREYLMNYAHKEGAPNNWKLNRNIWGTYNLLEETGFIRSQSAGKVSRKQAKFIEDFLLAIHLIDIEGNVDDNNIRSRLHSLMKNYDSIEELTEESQYKSSPNNKGGIRLF